MVKEYAKRLTFCVLSLALYGFGCFLGVKAGGVGTNAWNTLALECGPRDTLMIIIGRKIPAVPIGAVKFCIEIAVLLIGFLMGAPLGIGTVLVLVLQASIFQLVCRVVRYEPRSVEYEDVLDTCCRILGR